MKLRMTVSCSEISRHFPVSQCLSIFLAGALDFADFSPNVKAEHGQGGNVRFGWTFHWLSCVGGREVILITISFSKKIYNHIRCASHRIILFSLGSISNY